MSSRLLRKPHEDGASYHSSDPRSTRQRAWIGLGANLGDPERTLYQAFTWLDHLPDTRLDARSGLHVTAPEGPPAPDYLNAVARVVTGLAPAELLAALNALESAAGRLGPLARRALPNAPRVLDLDLLLFEDLALAGTELVLPHPRMAHRRFVLAPLCELDPELRHPTIGRSMRELLEALP